MWLHCHWKNIFTYLAPRNTQKENRRKWLTSVVHGEKHLTALKHSIQVARDGLSCHLCAVVESLTIGGMGVSLCQVVAIAILVEWVFQRVAVGWKLGACPLIAAISDSPNGCQFCTVHHPHKCVGWGLLAQCHNNLCISDSPNGCQFCTVYHPHKCVGCGLLVP